jgi:hypothetical protein
VGSVLPGRRDDPGQVIRSPISRWASTTSGTAAIAGIEVGDRVGPQKRGERDDVEFESNGGRVNNGRHPR